MYSSIAIPTVKRSRILKHNGGTNNLLSGTGGNTVQVLGNDYLAYIKHVRNFSPQTTRSYTYILHSFINRLEPDSLQNLTLQEIDQYIADFSEAHHLQPSSTNTVRCVLRSFFLYVDKYRDIRLRFDYASIRQVKAPRNPVVIASPNQVQEMIKHLHTPQDKIMMFTMFATGVRIGELIKMQVEDYHCTSITIRGKGGKLRTIPLDETLSRMLGKYIDDRNIRTGPIFRHQVTKDMYAYGAAYSVSGLRKRWQRQLTPHGLYMKPHSLRHGIATELMMAGMDIRTLQTFLGHSHIATTMLYTHVSDRHLEESYNKYYEKVKIPTPDLTS